MELGYHSESGELQGRDELFALLEQLDIPYVKVEIHGDVSMRKESPLGHMCDSFESLINGLLADTSILERASAAGVLGHFYRLIREELTLASSLFNDEQRAEALSGRIKEVSEKLKRSDEQGDMYPIPEVWLEAFDEQNEVDKK
jgi:CII-binding regulator of phage lambda lysogenization HflD|tara:strand:+ start:1570 stop:2001 length:432 start_codon:yes stop_codon:yes gene_type:complete